MVFVPLKIPISKKQKKQLEENTPAKVEAREIARIEEESKAAVKKIQDDALAARETSRAEKEEKRRSRLRSAGATGRRSTFGTSSFGLTTTANVRRRTLLGS